MKYEITKNCLGIVENTVFETSDLAEAEAQLALYSSGADEGAWTLWEVDDAGNDKLIECVFVGKATEQGVAPDVATLPCIECESWHNKGMICQRCFR